jgi:hypothetical protein
MTDDAQRSRGPNAWNEEGLTPVHAAMVKGDLAAFREALATPGIDPLHTSSGIRSLEHFKRHWEGNYSGSAADMHKALSKFFSDRIKQFENSPSPHRFIRSKEKETTARGHN